MKLPRRFKVVSDSDAADFEGIRVTLYRCKTGICGWFISPAGADPIADGYLRPSAKLIASSAVLRAIVVADRIGVEVCIIDPDNLWSEVWGGL